MNDFDFQNAELILDEGKADTLKIVEAEKTPQPKKRGRGRPKGSTKAKTEASTEEQKKADQDGSKYTQKSLDDELSGLESEFSGTPPEIINDSKEPEISEGVHISGAILLTICDAIIPRSITFVMGGGKEKAKKMKLDSAERKEMIPIADEAAKEVMKGVSPLQQFFIAMGAIYMSKL